MFSMHILFILTYYAYKTYIPKGFEDVSCLFNRDCFQCAVCKCFGHRSSNVTCFSLQVRSPDFSATSLAWNFSGMWTHMFICVVQHSQVIRPSCSMHDLAHVQLRWAGKVWSCWWKQVLRGRLRLRHSPRLRFVLVL